jgi:hypothetical protein
LLAQNPTNLAAVKLSIGFKKINLLNKKNLKIQQVFTTAINPLRQALIDVGNKDAAVLIYNGYSPIEKKAVWVDKIDQVLALNLWNENQIQVLVSLKNQIEPNIFVNNSKEAVDFQIWSSTWKANALLSFEISKLRFIVTLVSDYDPAFKPKEGEEGAPNCNCASGDDYCGGIIISTGDICNSKLKCTSVSGCGLFWRHSCNGTCQGAQPLNGAQTTY